MISLSAEIYVGDNKYEISDDLLNIEFSGQDRSDVSLPSWGIKSNSGYLEMYDTDGTIEKLNKQGSLANSPINIYLNVGNRKEQIGGFYVTNADKDRQTYKTKIEFEDILMSWNDILLKSKNPNPEVEHSVNSIILSVFKSLGMNFYVADEKTIEHLVKILISYPYFEEGSLWNFMNKICEVSMCYIYCRQDGKPVIFYDEGR